MLSVASRLHIDEVMLLGDLVGYNAAPSAVLQRLIALSPTVMIRGNHDKVYADIEPATSFHLMARRAIEWTRQQLSHEELAWLAALPEGPVAVDASGRTLQVCHGAPFDEDFYVVDAIDARQAIEHMSASVCLNGHTHLPAVFRTEGCAVRHECLEKFMPDDREPNDGENDTQTHMVEWPNQGRLLVNVGFVGQPRDADPRAAFGVWGADAGTIKLWRVPYDIATVQRRIVTARLPTALAKRLATGT